MLTRSLTIFKGSFLSKLLLPQWITVCLIRLGTSRFPTLNRTCSVLSPPMSKFSAPMGARLFFHTLWYLDSPPMIEAPTKHTSAVEAAHKSTNLLWASLLVSRRIGPLFGLLTHCGGDVASCHHSSGLE